MSEVFNPTAYNVTLTDTDLVVDGAGFDPTADVLVHFDYLPTKTEDGKQPKGSRGAFGGSYANENGVVHASHSRNGIITTTPGSLKVWVDQSLSPKVIDVPPIPVP